MNVTVDIKQVNEAFKTIAVNSEDARKLLNAVALYHLRQVSRTFQVQGARDGAPAWKPFSDQYTRVTDGVTVPAWGGVPKIRGKGLVKGRKRPSGKRITEQSKLLQDTGHLKNSFQKQLLEQKKVIYGSVLDYAGKHNYGDSVTPQRLILFFSEQDIRTIKDMLADYMVTGLLNVKHRG
jgi:phage gpG-like protein